MPKSVTKISRDGVTYTSNVDATLYSIQELTRAALKDVAKFVRREAKSRAQVVSGNLKRNIGTWVRKDKDGKIWLQIGVYNKASAAKKKLPYAFYAHFIEFGTKKRAAHPFLKPVVMENINQIVEIESKYLSGLSKPVLDSFDEKEEISND